MRLKQVYESIKEVDSWWTPSKVDYKVEDIEKILETYKDRLKKEGINVTGTVLGKGSQGMVFDAGNKVLKITKDKKEASSAAHIMGGQYENVYEVFKVFQFDATGYYGILQEKLERLQSSDAGVSLLAFGDTFKILNNLASGGGSYHRATQAITKESEYYADRYNVPESELKKGLQRVLGLILGIKDLHDLGIKYGDITLGNVMKRKNGMFVLIDIGYSRSPEIPIEEI
jgi:serine/threonine protein kinase